jgi:hypothetical protein
MDEPVTQDMKQKAQERRQLFISEVLYISDASDTETHAAGWGTRGKIEWLKSACDTYRKDLRRILKD